MSLSFPFLFTTLSLSSLAVQVAHPLAPDPIGADGDDDPSLASLLLGIDAPPPPSPRARPPLSPPPLSRDFLPQPTMPGGYPFGRRAHPLPAHFSTELWNEVVEEVQANFSSEDVLLPPETDDEHVVHSPPPRLGESLRTISDVHAQEQGLHELLQLTSPTSATHPVSHSPSPSTETQPSTAGPVTPMDPDESFLNIDLNFDACDDEDVDAGVVVEGILLPTPPKTGTTEPPQPVDFMLVLVRFGIRQVRPYQRRPGPPPPPGLKPTIMGSSYLADLVSVSSDLSAVLRESRPKSASKAVAARPADYGAVEDTARAMALAHAHCALHDLFDADVRLAPDYTYKEIIGGLLSALAAAPVMSYGVSTVTDVAVLQLLQLPDLMTARPALAMGVRPESIRVPLKRTNAKDESQCGRDLTVPMFNAGVAWGLSSEAEEGWFSWLFVEPLGLRSDQAAANVRLLTSMRLALGIYGKLFKVAQKLNPNLTQPRAHVTNVVYGIQTCGVLWRLVAMVDEDNGTYPVSTIWSGNVEEAETMACAIGLLRKIIHEADERLQCVRNWIACVCGTFGSARLVTPLRQTGTDALNAQFSSPTSRLKPASAAIRITAPVPIRSASAAPAVVKKPSQLGLGRPATLKHSLDHWTSTSSSRPPASSGPSRQHSPAEKRFRAGVQSFQPRAPSVAPSFPQQPLVGPPPGFEHVVPHHGLLPPPAGFLVHRSLIAQWAPPVLLIPTSVNWSHSPYNTWTFPPQVPADPYTYGHGGQLSQSYFGPVGGFVHPDNQQGARRISGGAPLPIGPGPIGSHPPSYATVASMNANERNGRARITS